MTSPEAFTSYIHSLPNEVLEAIFHHLVEELPRSEEPPKAYTPHIWALACVCKRWRSITLANPWLWSNLGAISFNFPNAHKANHLRRVQIHLERCGTSPISFDCSDLGALNVRAECDETLLLLAKHSPQWQSAHFSFSSSATSRYIQDVRGKVPLLRDLTLRFRGAFLSSKLDYFADAPSLRTVKVVDSLGFYDPLAYITLPWAQLVEYSSHGFGFHDAILALGPLTTLSYTVRGRLPFDNPVKHYSLRELNLNFIVFAEGLFFLSKLSLPSLINLTISCTPTTSIPLADLYTLLFRSECKLRSLALNGRLSSGMGILRILELCTDLRTLRCSHLSHSDLQQLTFPRSERQLPVPHLQELIFHLHRSVEELSPHRRDPIYPALDALARSRSEMYQNGLLAERLHITILVHNLPLWGPHRTHILAQLEGFPSTEDGHVNVASKPAPESSRIPNLNSYADTPANDSTKMASYSFIDRWEKVLRESQHRWPELSPLEKIASWPRLSSSVHQVLNEMEVFQITDSSIVWLNRMDIPRALDGLSFQLPGSKLLNFADRARSILDSWKPHLIADAMANRRWAMWGGDSIIYVHADDERRSGEQAWNMVVGFPSKTSPPL